MSMAIRDNSDSLRTLNIYTTNNTNLNKSVLKIAGGLKILGAGDAPSVFSITEHMRDRIRALDQANRNVQNDTSLMKVAEGAISNTIDILQTLREKAVNSANDHNTDEDRAMIQQEAEGYLRQIDDNAMVTFNGKRLLDGTQAANGLNFHVGGEANFSVTLKLESMTSSALGLDALDLSTREGAEDALGVNNGDGTWSNSKVVTDATTGEETTIYGLLDTALKKALDQQTTLGAVEARLGFTRDNLITASTNIQAAESSMVDTDVAAEMSNFMKWNVLMQSAQLMLAQQNQNAASVVDLLKPVSA